MYGKGKKTQMSNETEKQLNGFVVKQKAMIITENNEKRVALLIGMWDGFITGLKLTQAITFQEYKMCFDEIEKFAKELNKHEEIKKNCANISITGYGYELQGRCQAK